ncbi:MAG: hypothetical protein KGJ96_13290, partial [Xanthomonadaceae bacterium]|nr:hypothetical protein [Xanthomonadaceae bacterium]
EWDRDEACSTATHFERWWSRIALRANHAAERNDWERRLADALSEGSFADALRRRAAQDGHWRHTLQWIADMAADEPPLRQAGGWR